MGYRGNITPSRAVAPHRPLKPEAAVRIEMPDDLRAWIGESELIQVVLEAAGEAGFSRRSWPSGLAPATAFSPAALLTLLLFCYATGRYNSRQIEERYRQDPTLGYQAGRQVIEWEWLRRLRRACRCELAGALAQVLRRVWLRHFAARLPSSADPAIPEGAVPLGMLGPRGTFAELAAERIDRAVLEDALEADF